MVKFVTASGPADLRTILATCALFVAREEEVLSLVAKLIQLCAQSNKLELPVPSTARIRYLDAPHQLETRTGGVPPAAVPRRSGFSLPNELVDQVVGHCQSQQDAMAFARACGGYRSDVGIRALRTLWLTPGAGVDPSKPQSAQPRWVHHKLVKELSDQGLQGSALWHEVREAMTTSADRPETRNPHARLIAYMNWPHATQTPQEHWSSLVQASEWYNHVFWQDGVGRRVYSPGRLAPQKGLPEVVCFSTGIDVLDLTGCLQPFPATLQWLDPKIKVVLPAEFQLLPAGKSVRHICVGGQMVAVKVLPWEAAAGAERATVYLQLLSVQNFFQRELKKVLSATPPQDLSWTQGEARRAEELRADNLFLGGQFCVSAFYLALAAGSVILGVTPGWLFLSVGAAGAAAHYTAYSAGWALATRSMWKNTLFDQHLLDLGQSLASVTLVWQLGANRSPLRRVCKSFPSAALFAATLAVSMVINITPLVLQLGCLAVTTLLLGPIAAVPHIILSGLWLYQEVRHHLARQPWKQFLHHYGEAMQCRYVKTIRDFEQKLLDC